MFDDQRLVLPCCLLQPEGRVDRLIEGLHKVVDLFT
jgi:hypothetical protein